MPLLSFWALSLLVTPRRLAHASTRLLPMNTPVPPSRLVSRGRRMSAGFTLIELLTVIAIIGVLAALLLPTIGKVRENAKSTRCVENLRQVGMAIQGYVNDNKGLLPCVGFYGISSHYNRDPRNLQNSLLPYLGINAAQTWDTSATASLESAIFNCPGYKGNVGGKGYALQNPVLTDDGASVNPWGFMRDAQGNISTRPLPLAAMSVKAIAIRDSDAAVDNVNHSGYRNALHFDWHVGRIALPN